MQKILIIAKRELQSFFDSLMAYILLVVFLGFSGFFTWIYLSDIFFINQATLSGFFGIAYWTLFFIIPALTMKSLAEENRLGTIELLLTKPVNHWQIVAGKFVSILFLILIALLFTLPYYITVSQLGPIDHGAVLAGYLGLLLMASVYTALGIFASSVSGNQIVAFLLALFIGIFFHWIFEMLGGNLPGFIGGTLTYLSISTHFDALTRGVIDSKDIIYFISLTLLALFGARLNLEANRS